MKPNATNGRYLKWFNDIEKELWRLFALFGDLCARCALQTLADSESGRREGRADWCCCMIDNQVHDNWQALNANQNRFDSGWYEKLQRLELGRMPGNGPCPALGPTGCQLKKVRPITCTTQLCNKMLAVLNKLDLVKCPAHSALQIEDFLELPDILPALYGTARKPQRVSLNEVEQYLATVRELRFRFRSIPAADRQTAIDAVADQYGLKIKT
jgi:hypothetical protein